VLRFNFRGTGRSEGSHHGSAESADVETALTWLRSHYHLPVVLVGFSFGAAMSLAAACDAGASGVRALVALGLPTHASGRDYEYPFLENCSLPKLFLSGDHDQFAPTPQLQRIADTAAEPKTLVLLPGADHFFTGQLAQLQAALSTWLKERLL
jgi:alpha/beta superfamily hydrolase